MKRRTRLVAVVAVLALPLLGACSSGSNDIDGDAVLSTAAKELASTSGIELTLTGDLPDGVSGLTEATGTATNAPAFEGDLSVIASGLPVKAGVVAVDGKVYAKLPFTTSYTEIDPADYGAPDPAIIMDRDQGLPSWLQSLVGSDSTAKEVREGSAVLTEVSSTLSGEVVASLIPTADPQGQFDVVVRVDSDGRATSISATGPFYPGTGDVTYKAEITAYDVNKTITAP
jgi:lipoprotein LprG